MDFEPENQKIIELLSKLKERGGTYPKKMLESRREIFLSQMASVGAGLGIGAGLKTVTKASKTANLFHLSSFSASSFVEALLVAVIVIQSSVIAYSYRDKILDFVNSLTSSPTPTEVSMPVIGESATEVAVSDTPLATETLTETVTATVELTSTTGSSGSGNESGVSTVQNSAATATPQPTKDNPGNHYGQTPKPSQQKNDTKPTKANGNGGNGNKP